MYLSPFAKGENPSFVARQKLLCERERARERERAHRMYSTINRTRSSSRDSAILFVSPPII